MESYILIGLSLGWSLSIIGILSWGIISSKGHWTVKVTSTLLVFALLFGTIYVWREIQGTPKLGVELDGLIVRSYLIKEPKGNNPGKIWMWVTNPFGTSEPINIGMPYSKQMHKLLTENKGLQQGKAQRFNKKNRGQTEKKNNGDRDSDSEDEYNLNDALARDTIKT